MSKSDCDDQEWSVIDDAESPINPAASPSCIDSDFEDLANPQIEGDQSAECVEEKSSAEPFQFVLPLSVATQQPIAIVAEVKQDSVQVEITPPSDTQSPCSVPSVSIHTESVAVSPQLQTAEEPHNMSGSDMPSSPESSVLDPSPCSPSMNAVLEFLSSAPQSESEPEDDEKHFDLHEQADQEETGEVEESSFLTLQCPMCSRHSTSEKQCSFCCFQLQWDCPRCTYLNSFADDACLMCSLGAEPNQPSTQHTATLTNTHTRTPICEPTHAEADDVDESAEFDDVSFYKDSDRRRCATDASVKRQKDRVAVKVSIPLQFNLLNQSARVLNEEAARKREVQAVQEFNVEDVVRIRSMLRFKASNATASSAKRDPAARTSDNTDLNCDEEYSEHVRSVVSRRNAKSRAAKSKRSQAKLNSHDKRKARSDVRKSLSQAFDWEDLGTFRQQCADRHATELLSGTLASRAYWRSNEDVMELKSIRTIPLPDNLIDRFFEKCKSVSGKKSKYVLSLCMQRISLVHPSLRERLSLLDTENAYCLVVFAVISHPGCFYYPPADHELPLFEVSYTYRYTEKAAVPSVTSDQIANRTTLAQLHKMADRLRSKAFFEADLVRHSQEAPLSVE